MSSDHESLAAEDIRDVYRHILGRMPSDAEVATWLTKKFTLAQMRNSFLASVEFGKVYENATGKTNWTASAAQVIINIRIPKTAGTSLTSIIARSFQADAVLYTDDADLSNLMRLGASERLKVRMVAGHIQYGIGALFPQRVLYVTMLRTPLERIYSFYRYVRRTQDHPLNRLFLTEDMTFGEFLEQALTNYHIRREVDNGQVRRLAGDMTGASFPDTALLYRRAAHNLFASNMLFGVASNFEGFLRRLVAEGIIPKATQLHSNSSPGGETSLDEVMSNMTEYQLELARYFTYWDDLLYTGASAAISTD